MRIQHFSHQVNSIANTTRVAIIRSRWAGILGEVSVPHTEAEQGRVAKDSLQMM